MVDEKVEEEGQIEKPQPESVRKEPLQVPGMEFVEIDMHNDAEVLFSHPYIKLTVTGPRSL